MLASVCAGVRALRADPSPATAAALLLAVAVSLVAFEGLRRWSRRRHAG
jgi:hypothetical protein